MSAATCQGKECGTVSLPLITRSMSGQSGLMAGLPQLRGGGVGPGLVGSSVGWEVVRYQAREASYGNNLNSNEAINM